VIAGDNSEWMHGLILHGSGIELESGPIQWSQRPLDGLHKSLRYIIEVTYHWLSSQRHGFLDLSQTIPEGLRVRQCPVELGVFTQLVVIVRVKGVGKNIRNLRSGVHVSDRPRVGSSIFSSLVS
jgi:hypothetical protein